jgi:VWFA-related protein
MGLFRPLVLSGAAAALSLAAAVAPALPPAAATEEPAVRVRFLEPAPPGLILGQTRITVEAAVPADARLERVEIYVDDRLLSVLETPPYTLTWDAGTRFTRRVLRAVAIDSLGRRGEAVLEARPLYVGQFEEVRLVTLYAAVRDRKGNAVLDLKAEDFTVLEDGAPQVLTHFTPARLPLALALLVDASNSMNLGGKIDLARRAAEEFVDEVDEDDRLLVLHFNDALLGSADPLADRRQVKAAIAAIQARGGTALYDAVHRTAERLAGMDGRRVIVLLSDGRDQALEENEPGSLRLFEEALEKAHRSEVAIYAIGLGNHLDAEMDLARVRSLKEILDTFARQTGGRSYYPERAGQLAGVYKRIAADLKTQYALAYVPPNRTRDGAWRSISVRVRGGQDVLARSGYYAPAAPAR